MENKDNNLIKTVVVLATIFDVVWIASKAWKTGQK
jgi:hypothetical protein